MVNLKAHTPTFDVEIKGALEVTTELHLTMDAHGSALVSAKEYTKDFNKR